MTISPQLTAAIAALTAAIADDLNSRGSALGGKLNEATKTPEAEPARAPDESFAWDHPATFVAGDKVLVNCPDSGINNEQAIIASREWSGFAGHEGYRLTDRDGGIFADDQSFNVEWITHDTYDSLPPGATPPLNIPQNEVVPAPELEDAADMQVVDLSAGLPVQEQDAVAAVKLLAAWLADGDVHHGTKCDVLEQHLPSDAFARFVNVNSYIEAWRGLGKTGELYDAISVSGFIDHHGVESTVEACVEADEGDVYAMIDIDSFVSHHGVSDVIEACIAECEDDVCDTISPADFVSHHGVNDVVQACIDNDWDAVVDSVNSDGDYVKELLSNMTARELSSAVCDSAKLFNALGLSANLS